MDIELRAADPDNDSLTTIEQKPVPGVLSGGAPNLTYTPEPATVLIQVKPNEPPIPHPQYAETDEDTPIELQLTGEDTEGSPLRSRRMPFLRI